MGLPQLNWPPEPPRRVRRLWGALGSVESEPEAEPQAAAGGPEAPLSLGASAAVGEYEVTVDAVDLDADAEIAAANQFNDSPVGRYVLVDLTVTYAGAGEGDPWVDLTSSFVGTDARLYANSACTSVTPRPAVDVPTLLSGGTASFQWCMDVPPAAIDGGQLFVEEMFSFTNEGRVYWHIG